MDAILGLVVWGFLGYLLYRLVRKIIAKTGASASAHAEANAEGGEANSGAHADVGGIHIHLHIGDGISLSRSDDADGAINLAELLRPRTVNGVGISSMSDGTGDVLNAGGNAARTLPAGVPVRRARRNNDLAVEE